MWFKRILIHFICLWIGLASVTAHASLNSSIPLFNEWDLERCSSQVEKAHQLGNKAVNFIPTIHFVADEKAQLQYYCFNSKKVYCRQFDSEVYALLKSYYSKCFEAARDRNLKILILPHIDPAGFHIWRNDLEFDPLADHNGFSYFQTVLHPLEEALLEVLPANYPVEVALQGEMGKTIFHFAQSYEKIFVHMKTNLSSLANKVGISLNFNKVGGTLTGGSPEQLLALQSLIDRVDFVGISAYHAVALPLQASSFAANIASLAGELALHSITLPLTKEIHFSEIGLGGGGAPHDGHTPAKTVEECARSPWSGVRGAYSEEIDPWANAELRQFRFDFYKNLLEFLNAPNARVTEANIWNVNSWDVQGLYSNNYFDSDIIDLIANSNR